MLLAIVLAVPAGAQPAIEVKPRFELALGERLTNADAFGAKLEGRIGHNLPGDASELPIVVSGSLWLPRGLSFNGDEFPTCSSARLRSRDGVDGCPKRSIVGRPKAYGRADGVGSVAVVDAFTDASYVFLNGGERRIWAYTTFFNPALVREPIAVDVRKLRGRRWSYRVEFVLPAVMRVVAGVPITLRTFDLAIDGVALAPGYLTSSRRCPKRGHLAYRADFSFLHGDGATSEASQRGRLWCSTRSKSSTTS